MGEENWKNQKNRGEISPGELRRGGMRYPTRVEISAARHLGHGGCVRGSGEYASGFFLLRLLFGNKKPLSLIVGSLSTMPAKKSGLGLLNPVTPEKGKYLISRWGSTELIRDVTGGG